jgi:hypothetical protein
MLQAPDATAPVLLAPLPQAPSCLAWLHHLPVKNTLQDDDGDEEDVWEGGERPV